MSGTSGARRIGGSGLLGEPVQRRHVAAGNRQLLCRPAQATALYSYLAAPSLGGQAFIASITATCSTGLRMRASLAYWVELSSRCRGPRPDRWCWTSSQEPGFRPDDDREQDPCCGGPCAGIPQRPCGGRVGGRSTVAAVLGVARWRSNLTVTNMISLVSEAGTGTTGSSWAMTSSPATSMLLVSRSRAACGSLPKGTGLGSVSGSTCPSVGTDTLLVGGPRALTSHQPSAAPTSIRPCSSGHQDCGEFRPSPGSAQAAALHGFRLSTSRTSAPCGSTPTTMGC